MIRSLLTLIALIAGWAMVAATAVGVWLHFYPTRGTISVYVVSAVPFLVFPAVGAVLVFALLRRWFMLPFAVIAALVFGFTQAPLWIGTTVPDGPVLTVMSTNMLVGAADVDDIAAIVVSDDVDVLAIQEMTPEALVRIRDSEIADRLPFDHADPRPGPGGSALFSSLELRDPRAVENMMFANLEAVADVPGAGPTRLLSVHPPAPIPTAADWRTEMIVLGDHLASLPPGPAIVAGDFNATWDQVRYRDLASHGFVDAGEQVGAGFVPTYPTDRFGGNRPIIAIDHVLVRGFVTKSLSTRFISGSDHRAVVVSLVAS